MIKNLKIGEDVHTLLKRACHKDETFGEGIRRIVTEADFLPQLKDILAKTIERVEASKKRGGGDVGAPDDLIRIVGRFIDHVEQRGK